MLDRDRGPDRLQCFAFRTLRDPARIATVALKALSPAKAKPAGHKRRLATNDPKQDLLMIAQEEDLLSAGRRIGAKPSRSLAPNEDRGRSGRQGRRARIFEPDAPTGPAR